MKHNIVNMMNAVCMLVSSAGYCVGVISTLPMKSANMSRAIPILMVCPINRMVLTVADATP